MSLWVAKTTASNSWLWPSPHWTSAGFWELAGVALVTGQPSLTSESSAGNREFVSFSVRTCTLSGMEHQSEEVSGFSGGSESGKYLLGSCGHRCGSYP